MHRRNVAPWVALNPVCCVLSNPTAPRAYWKGYLRLSLVSCPIALYPATSEREKIRFNQINRETGNRIRPPGGFGRTLYLISMSSVALRRAAAVAGGKRTEIISAGVLPMPPRPTPFSYGSVAL